MKQSPRYNQIQENMKPGAFTAHGFLGEDDRALKDIIRQDDADVEKLDLSHAQIAGRMQYFTELGKELLDIPVVVDEIYEVLVDDHRGEIPCPFADNQKAIKTNTRFTNKKLGITIYWSDLNIHMIRYHGFYEGKGSFFRNDPQKLAKALGLI
ncbi:MAG: hypothetical protein JXN10_09770 [Clostridia bacterium]|nr:hypothetical protein [Clostridia bacterium]MBN2883805.1 hypothetical protein [Clostridia bacterium]